MTDKKKRLSSRCTENLSPAELRAQIEEDKKKVSRSTVFLFAALIAIIAICIAWFVSNTRVHITTETISAQDSTMFELASVGSRTMAESEKLKDGAEKNLLTAGSERTYSNYYEWKNGKWVINSNGGVRSYHVGTADLAWYLQSANSTVSPGASGKLEFYIIPKVENLKSVTVKLNVAAYGKASNNSAIEESNDDVLKRLIKGHILLFQNLDDQKGYSNWLRPDDGKYTCTVSAPVSDGFQINCPYKVTVYWIWPKYFRNYIYMQKSTQEDLFGNSPDKTTYDNLLKYVKEQRTLNGSTLFYDKAGKGTDITGDINNSMDGALLDTCSQYYDDADEYIGTNAGYLYVRAEAEGATSND